MTINVTQATIVKFSDWTQVGINIHFKLLQSQQLRYQHHHQQQPQHPQQLQQQQLHYHPYPAILLILTLLTGQLVTR